MNRRDGAEELLRRTRRRFRFIDAALADGGCQGPKVATTMPRTATFITMTCLIAASLEICSISLKTSKRIVKRKYRTSLLLIHIYTYKYLVRLKKNTSLEGIQPAWRNSMNKSFRTTAAAFALASALALGGCAETPTAESTGEYVDNTAITAKVKAAILQDPALKVMQISVKTYKDVVQLSGFVDTAAMKARAGTVASQVAGVGSVKNDLVVK